MQLALWSCGAEYVHGSVWRPDCCSNHIKNQTSQDIQTFHLIWTFYFLHTSFPLLWEVFKTQQLTFRLLLLMALLGNSLQGFSISSAEGSTSEACSAAAVSIARWGIPSPSPHFGLSPSVSPPSLWVASGGLLVVWPALIKWNVFIRQSWNVEWLWEINSTCFWPSAFQEL